MPKRDASNTLLQIQMWMLFAYVAVYLSKTVFILFDLLASLPALWKRCRYRSLSWFGAALGLITFVGMWWGALVNRHRIQVCEVEVEMTGLPESFDGYRIAQISDLHVGTYGNDTAFIHDLVEKVNSLNPNLVVFTGDIVNRTTSE
ncbi:MAG: metallophosphoesterase, partial [Muribaculaceae bacterium]|nr:metallophosphoesterase [Muribaculaceae bacterium]